MREYYGWLEGQNKFCGGQPLRSSLIAALSFKIEEIALAA
jgi:hypothetical protein